MDRADWFGEQFECAGVGGYGGGDGSVADCDQGVEGEEDPFGCEAVSA